MLLAWWSEARNLRAGSPSVRAGVPEWDLQRVLEGAEPSPSLLRRLAPVLGLHAADLFAIAGAAIPDDLAPRPDGRTCGERAVGRSGAQGSALGRPASRAGAKVISRQGQRPSSATASPRADR